MHIASVTCVEWDSGRGPPTIFSTPVKFDLTPADSGSFKIDYETIKSLSLICRLGREIIRTAGFKPGRIEFDDDTWGFIDSSADVVCFNTPHNLRRLGSPCSGYLDYDGNGMEKLRRGGAIVTSDAWRTVLSRWIQPVEPSCIPYDMAVSLGVRHEAEEGWQSILDNLPKAEEFYFMLPEVSQQDWDTYYNKFPIAFRDRDAVYVVVNEKALHDRTICSLRQRDFAVNVGNIQNWHDLNPDFAARMDAHMTPAQRVSLLLGLLEGPNMAKRYRHCRKVAVGVLARSPSKPPLRVVPANTSFNDIGNTYDRTTFRIRKRAKMSADCTEMWNGLYLGLSEADWMKMTLDRVFAHSEEQYSLDAAHEREG